MVADIPPEMRDRNPYAVTARLPYRAKENGFPSAAELGRISALEDRIIRALHQSGFLHAGHVTSNGVTRVVLYGPANSPASLKVRAGLISKICIDFETRHDPNWELFREVLEPTESEYESSRFRPLMKKLTELGDDHTKSRTVEFAVLFASNEARKAFIDEIAAADYLPTETEAWESGGQFWCELGKETSIEPDVFYTKTAYLRRIAQKHGGDLDGWQTPVMK